MLKSLLEALKCKVDVSPRYDSSLVFGLVNFRGLIFFLENTPKPLISTLPSRATVLIIFCKMRSMESSMTSSFKDENFLDKIIARSDLLKFCI